MASKYGVSVSAEPLIIGIKFEEVSVNDGSPNSQYTQDDAHDWNQCSQQGHTHANCPLSQGHEIIAREKAETASPSSCSDQENSVCPYCQPLLRQTWNTYFQHQPNASSLKISALTCDLCRMILQGFNAEASDPNKKNIWCLYSRGPNSSIGVRKRYVVRDNETSKFGGKAYVLLVPELTRGTIPRDGPQALKGKTIQCFMDISKSKSKSGTATERTSSCCSARSTKYSFRIALINFCFNTLGSTVVPIAGLTSDLKASV
jgi:hypothetical protein